MKRALVANRIKIVRLEKSSLTQSELAKQVGVTRQTMNLIESQKYNPSIHICINISKCLGKSVDELFWLNKEV